MHCGMRLSGGIAFLSTGLAGDEIDRGELRVIPVETPSMMLRLRRYGRFQEIAPLGFGGGGR